MSMALEYLDMIPGDSAGPTAVLKDRIYHSGNAGVLQHSPAPPFPFAEQPVAAAAASTAPQLPSQTSIGEQHAHSAAVPTHSRLAMIPFTNKTSMAVATWPSSLL